MNKKILLAVTLTLFPASQPIQAHSYVQETIAAVGTAACVMVLGILGWKSLVYSQQENDKECINTLVTLNPENQIHDISALFKQAQISKKSVGELLAQHCITHHISADDLCSKLNSYTQKADKALAQLKTNACAWNKNNHELASVATQTLNDPRMNNKINDLHDMCRVLAQEKEYAQLYCGYHTIATRNHVQPQKQFYLVYAVNDMAIDLEKLTTLLRKLETVHAHNTEQYSRYTKLKNSLKEKVTELSHLHQKIINSREYIEQKSSQFIFTQQQTMVALEQDRITIEKTKAEKERLIAQYKIDEKNRDWNHLNQKVHVLTVSNKKLSEDKESYIQKLNEKNESLNALRVELESLKLTYAALEKIKAQLIAELNNAPAAASDVLTVQEYKKIEQELKTLKNKIAELQRKIANPPFNPSSPEMISWMKKEITELLA